MGCLLTITLLWLLSLLLFEHSNNDADDEFSLDEPLFDRRAEDDGTWYSQIYPYQFHLYSAFYDNRTTLGSSVAYLRIIVVMETLPYGYRLFCKINYPHPTRLRASMESIGAGVTYQKKHYMEYVLTCDLPRGHPPPRSVTLTDGRRGLNISRVPVEVPQRPNVLEDLAVCVSVSYYDLEPRRLVEWLEMQRILGVSRVFIYNNSVTGEANRVLAFYRDEGFVVVRQSFSFLHGQDEKLIHLHMSPVINDCMYRYMHSFRYFAVIDLDEVIVPRGLKFLPELISSLPESFNSERVGSYVFRNAYFFFDLTPQAHDLDTGKSTYLEYQRRLHPSPPEYSVKSIVDSQACIAMHNHYCLKYTYEFSLSWNQIVDIPPKVALLHHYKWCHFDVYLESPGTCATMMKSSVFDDVMKRYRHKLLKNLSIKLQKLGLSGV